MLLTSTTDKLSIITEQSGDLDVVVSYIDRVISTGAVGAANRQLTAVTTATTTDIVAAPASDTARKVLAISVRNAHASTSIDVVVQYNANGTLYEMHAARLYATEKLEWDEAQGFKLIKRSNLPFYATRISKFNTRANVVVTGNDINMVHVHNCDVNVPPKTGGITRVLSSFYHWFGSGAATTTGIGIGQQSPAVAFSASNNQNITSCVSSVLAATLSSHDAGGGDSLVANGTQSVTPDSGFGAGTVKWTEDDPIRDYPWPVYLGLQSEVGGSQVTVSSGSWFCLFESTEV